MLHLDIISFNIPFFPQARKLPTNYNEVTYTYFTVFTMDTILVAYLSILYTADHAHNTMVTTAIVTLITGELSLKL